MDEGDGVAGVGQQVVLNANLEKVGHREVLGRHLGIPTKFQCVRLLLIYKNILSDKIFMANF